MTSDAATPAAAAAAVDAAVAILSLSSTIAFNFYKFCPFINSGEGNPLKCTPNWLLSICPSASDGLPSSVMAAYSIELKWWH